MNIIDSFVVKNIIKSNLTWLSYWAVNSKNIENHQQSSRKLVGVYEKLKNWGMEKVDVD